MKKIYSTPTTDIVKVGISNILAGSLTLTESGGTGELQNEKGDGGVLSRSNNMWDEEDY